MNRIGTRFPTDQMTHFQSGHHGHFERAFPSLTPGVKLLIAINLALWVIKGIGFDLIANYPIARFVGLSCANVFDAFGLGIVRFFTYQFFHDVNPLHVVWNMIFLYFFGVMVEGEHDQGYEGSHLRQGKSGLIVLFVCSGIAGGLGHLLFSSIMGMSAVPVIGASGSVYGIMVYAACMFPRRRIHMIFIQPELRYFVGFLLFIGVFQQLAALRFGTSSGVSDAAHIGGAVWGFFAFKLSRKGLGVPDPVQWMKRKRDEGAVKTARRDQETLDKILEKVHQKGMAELSPAERRFLEKVSKNSRK